MRQMWTAQQTREWARLFAHLQRLGIVLRPFVLLVVVAGCQGIVPASPGGALCPAGHGECVTVCRPDDHDCIPVTQAFIDRHFATLERITELEAALARCVGMQVSLVSQAFQDAVDCTVQGWVYTNPGDEPSFTRVDVCTGIKVAPGVLQFDGAGQGFLLYSPTHWVLVEFPQPTTGTGGQRFSYRWKAPHALLDGQIYPIAHGTDGGHP